MVVGTAPVMLIVTPLHHMTFTIGDTPRLQLACPAKTGTYHCTIKSAELKRRLALMSRALGIVILVGAMLLPSRLDAATPSSFTYQGRLADGGIPANAAYDFHFTLYSQASGGSQLGSVVTNDNLTVVDGLFVANLDFGSAAFDGNNRYLLISIRPAGSGSAYTDLGPRQSISPSPYAIHALDSASVGGVVATNVATRGDTELIISPLLHERSVVLNRTLNENGTIDLSTTDPSSDRRVLFPLNVPDSLSGHPQKLKRVTFDYNTVRTTAGAVSITDVSVRMLNNAGGYTALYHDTTLRQNTSWSTVVLQPLSDVLITGSIILRIRMTFSAAADTFSVGTIKATVGE
jgi:hypothetical protein